MASSNDRSYTLLLNHLHNPGTKLALQTIQGALSHHLADLSPVPTPLAATAISSPFFLSQPITYQKLTALLTAFRHAAHLKFRALRKEEEERGRLEALFKKSFQSSMDTWAKDVVKGLQGGHPVLRLASCGGLLLGIEDLKHAAAKSDLVFDIPGARGLVEDEDIVALAEVMDTYAFTITAGSVHGVEEWEKEFQPAGQDMLSMALILASKSFPLIPQNKLKVLPLPPLSQILTSTICAAFKSGSFLSSVSASVTLTADNQVHISPTSVFSQTVQSMTSSPLSSSISSLARFTANVQSLLLDLPSSHLDEHMRAVSQCLLYLQDAAKTTEKDWISTSLASVTENEIAPDTKELAKSVWSILKTFLFTVIMVSDAALSASVFIPPGSTSIPASALALTTLHTLSYLAFVISEFGGVTSTSTNSFLELKKTFYLALDILAQGDGSGGYPHAEAYVEQACMALNSRKVEGNVGFRQAKEAFTIASVEQLVPVLREKCLRDWVWGICFPHLFDASHRETFESSHSTVLAIFASHAQRQTPSTSALDDAGLPSPRTWFDRVKQRAGLRSSLSSQAPLYDETENDAPAPAGFVKRMVPFYAQCLIENSKEGKLSTAQLRMAYSALVRGACASSVHDNAEGEDEPTYTLAWYCVQLLLDTIEQGSPTADEKGKGKGREEDHDPERIHRLRLALISSIESLPLALLGKALDEVAGVIMAGDVDGEARKELVEALFAEILEGVGDREKEYAMRWWYTRREELSPGTEFGDMRDLEKGAKKDESSEEDKVISRL